ncbi:MAG: hypothetical protein RL483_1579, partial [Pseudomonadota bacterium]
STVAVFVDDADPDLFPKDKVGQVLTALLAKGLVFLGCINPGEPDFGGSVAGSQHGDGVPIGDGDDFPDDFRWLPQGLGSAAGQRMQSAI